jgi:uncharacterized delta-60 repeat protein
VTLATVLVTGVAWAAKAGDLDRSFGGDGVVHTKMGGKKGGHGQANSVAIGVHRRIVAVGGSVRSSNGETTSRFAVARYLPNGNLDRDFSGDGKAFASLGPLSYANSGAIDGQERIVVAGESCGGRDEYPRNCEFALARFTRDGELDRSFGNGGRVTTAFPGGARARSVVARHGGIVVAGVADGEIAVARYNRDGRLVPRFGDGGKVTTDVSAGDESGNSVAIASHQRIVVGSGGGEFAITEYGHSGRLRQSFGVGGTARAAFGGYDAANSVAIDKRDRIVAAGYTQFEEHGGADRAAFALARFGPDGQLDDSFSHNGKVKTRITKFVDYANAVAIDSRKRIVAVGVATGGLGLARYKRDGELDRSFGGNGIVRSRSIGADDALAIDSRDRIVTAGGAFGLARFIGYR